MIVESQNYTVMLTLVLANRTKKTLHNVMIEIIVGESAKLAERPAMFNFPPEQLKVVKLVYKVVRTETFPICGYVTYSGSSGNVVHAIPFDHIPYPLQKHVVPAKLDADEFARLWGLMRWSWKLPVIVKPGSMNEFVKNMSNELAMEIISPLCDEHDFVTANLYGRTKLGTFS